MSGYDPQDFKSVITYMRREFGPEVFRNPSRMYAVFCDLSPKLKPYGNVARQLAERGILSELEAASAGGDAWEQSRVMMKAQYVLENELLLGADRVEYFLSVFGNLYGVTPSQPTPQAVATPKMVPIMRIVPPGQTVPTPQAAPTPKMVPIMRIVPPGQTVPTPQTVPPGRTASQPRILSVSGKSGGLTWKLDSAGNLTISGHGDMENYTHQAYHQSTAPWSAYQAAITSAILRDGVTSVGQEAFSYCAKLQSVMIPSSVTKIGDMAFRRCAALRRVTIPHSVREIGVSAFDGCAGLKSINIPRGVEHIKAYAFAECGSLTSVTIPNSVRRIGYRAFHYCVNLSKAYVPADADINSDAFDSHTVVTRW